ncbi:MAG: transcriptional repressor [Bacillota bacterium]|jgi:hypothetical protein
MGGFDTSSRFSPVRKRLVGAGIRCSYPRILVLDYLLTNKTHPTADEIYCSISKVIPTLSKTTVYNTLNLLVNASLAREVTIEGHETRYDGTVDVGSVPHPMGDKHYIEWVEVIEAVRLSAGIGCCPRLLQSPRALEGGTVTESFQELSLV